MSKEIMPLNNSPLRNLEIKLTVKLSRYVPDFIGTKALTFLSLFSSIFVFVSYYLSKSKNYFLFFASFFILGQWVFDCLDGTVGRLRGEGFARWGFYMDHLFDYFFMASIISGLYFLFPRQRPQILLLFFIGSYFMISFFLMHDVTNDKEPNFKISFLGISPIEFRLFIIVFNALLYFAKSYIEYLISNYLIHFNLLLFVFLITSIFLNQKKLHDIDVSAKSGKYI